MKLKDFDTINSSARTIYNVYDDEMNHLYSFSVDYTNKDEEFCKSLDEKMKLIEYGANVEYVNVDALTKFLKVAVSV